MDREELLQSLEGEHNKIKTKELENKAKQFQTKADLEAQIEYKQRREGELVKQEEQERKRQEQMEAAYHDKHWNMAMDKLKL